MILESNDNNKIINLQSNQLSTISNPIPTDYISKQQLISYLNKKIEDNPIYFYYEESDRYWMKGYVKAFKELLMLLQ